MLFSVFSFWGGTCRLPMNKYSGWENTTAYHNQPEITHGSGKPWNFLLVNFSQPHERNTKEYE